MFILGMVNFLNSEKEIKKTKKNSKTKMDKDHNKTL